MLFDFEDIKGEKLMALIADEFLGQYSLSKTLKFELVPQGKTKDLIKNLDDSILAIDAKRAAEYKNVKKILDDYYRFFIEQVLVKNILEESEVEEAYIAFQQRAKDSKAFEKSQDNMRKKIAKALKDGRSGSQLDAYEKLFKTDDKSELYKWLNYRKDRKELTEELYESYKKSLQQFDKFTTYFTGYKDNRENLFSAEEKSSAISYRIVNENMVRFFENCQRFEEIQKKHEGLYEQLKVNQAIFQFNKFTELLSQSKIDEYNRMIGFSIENSTTKGINSLINEYRQKNHIKNKELPMMVQLYKQLLSDREKSFVIDEITSDEEMEEKAIECCREVREIEKKLALLVKEYVNEDNTGRIYLRGSKLTDLSQNIYGQWDIINKALQMKLETLATKKQKEEFDKRYKKAININELHGILQEFFTGLDSEEYKKLHEKPAISELIVENIPVVEYSPVLNGLGFGTKEERINKIKGVFDQIISMLHYYKIFYLYEGNKQLEVAEKDAFFYSEFDGLYNDLSLATKVYDHVRNYVTKKPYSENKIKVNFNAPTLLNGWDINKEESNLNVLLEKNGLHYLAIMDTNHRRCFDLKDIEVAKVAFCDLDKPYFNKIEYKQVTGANKMLPKVFFAESNIDYYAPSSEIRTIREKGLYKKDANNIEAMWQWIDFCKQSTEKHPEWNKYFKFNFKPTKNYMDVNGFYRDFDNQAYSIKKVRISEKYINDLVAEGQLYLFQIYNKDFSQYSKGKQNLHTMYWRMLFDSQNLKNIELNANAKIFKLNGEAEIFFRRQSLEKNITHTKDMPIANKNPHNTKKQSTFEYDLIKDKRYTENKLFFHCPITINFRASSLPAQFNKKVNKFIANNPDINIIGIDRGERHLLYFTIINQKGEILEQGSLNHIKDNYISNGKEVPVDTDYHELLDRKEKERDAARKNWTTIENIKELKAGYLSQVVHQLAELMIKYNAIVVLENLNAGFKNGRVKVEKQVYQNFEKALINKLNYLVFKDCSLNQPGGVLKGYQLTAPFDSFRSLGSQSGFLYYVYPSYTSHICPKTGFVDLLHPKYQSVAEAQRFFERFEFIRFNQDEGYFEFGLDYDRFGKKMNKSKWIVCTYGDERYGFDGKDMTAKKYNVTDEISALLDKVKIVYGGGRDIKNDISTQDDKAFFKSLLYFLCLTMQMRNTNGGTNDDNDYILSPVQDKKGNFFDSREANDTEPKNADANGAYHIALKGLKLISSIDEEGKLVLKKTETQDWFNFAQEKSYLK